MKRRLLLVSLLVAAVASAAACRDEDVASVEAAAAVVLAEVATADLEEHIEASGELRAQDDASIASEVAARVTAVLVDDGDAVAEGQVLVEIDPERRELEVADARAGLTEAEASLRERQRDHDRVRSLHERDIASDAQLDQAATELALARSRVEAARARLGVAARALEDASVRAPFAGRVARRQVSRGEYVQVGQTLFDLVALDPIEVEFHVAERDSARVALEQDVEVRVSPYPEEQFWGRVSVIAPTIDPATRTLRVEAEIENADGRLRPGLFARVDLGVAVREDVLLVPEEAVLQRADGEIVYVAEADDRVRRVPVETGIHRAGLVEVTRGLRPGEHVVVRGQAGLVDGALVSPRNPDGTLARSASDAETATP